MTEASSAIASATCPDCQGALALQQHEGVQLLACAAGHGVFVHADSLRAALADRSDDRPPSEEQASEAAQGGISVELLEEREVARPCPTCSVVMDKQVFAGDSGVAIDSCDDHGVWLETGELQRIEAWYEAQEHHKAADTKVWAGQTGRLEQLEEQHERRISQDHVDAHWRPVGRVIGAVSWWWSRRDDR